MGVPLLAMVAFDKRAARSPIAFRGDAHSARSEAYRTLRTNLQFVDVDNPPRIIAVTSAVPGEGKTSTAINLAASLAEAGGRVCLIEADLRRPSIANPSAWSARPASPRSSSARRLSRRSSRTQARTSRSSPVARSRRIRANS